MERTVVEMVFVDENGNEEVEQKKEPISVKKKGNNTRYTIEEIRLLVEKNDMLLITKKYINARTKLEIKCRKCDDISSNRADRLIKYNCQNCVLIKKREDVFKLIKDNVEKLNHEFISCNTHIHKLMQIVIKCLKCSQTCNISYWSLKNNHICSCTRLSDIGGKLKLEDIKKTVKNGGDTFISGPDTRRNILTIECSTCQRHYKTEHHLYKNGYRCLHCNGKRRKHDIISIRKLVKESGDILISQSYTTCKEKIEINCQRCGKNYLITLDSFCKGRKCMPCGIKSSAQKKIKYDIEYVREFVKKRGDTLCSKNYLKTYDIVDIKCLKCKKIFSMPFNNYKQGIGCSHCKFRSKGEERVSRYLDKKSINYVREHRFPKCKYINTLRFDFLVTLQKSFVFCIEYNGKQHYRVVKRFGGEDGLKRREIRDQIKKDYCEKENIPLLIIHYKDYENVEKLIDEFIKNIK